jgi:hypothetical protein
MAPCPHLWRRYVPNAAVFCSPWTYTRTPPREVEATADASCAQKYRIRSPSNPGCVVTSQVALSRHALSGHVTSGVPSAVGRFGIGG